MFQDVIHTERPLGALSEAVSVLTPPTNDVNDTRATFARRAQILRERPITVTNTTNVSMPRTMHREVGDISFLITRDPLVIRQYLDIRHDAYTKYLNLNTDFSKLDQVDAFSYFFVAMKMGECIGGGRMTLTNPSVPNVLPLESNGFYLDEAFPEYNLSECKYCEITRLAVKEEYRDGVVSSTIIRLIIDYVKATGVKYVFWVAPKIQARSYRLAIRNKEHDFDAVIRDDVTLPHKPVYEYLQMVISVLIPK